MKQDIKNISGVVLLYLLFFLMKPYVRIFTTTLTKDLLFYLLAKIIIVIIFIFLLKDRFARTYIWISSFLITCITIMKIAIKVCLKLFRNFLLRIPIIQEPFLMFFEAIGFDTEKNAADIEEEIQALDLGQVIFKGIEDLKNTNTINIYDLTETTSGTGILKYLYGVKESDLKNDQSKIYQWVYKENGSPNIYHYGYQLFMYNKMINFLKENYGKLFEAFHDALYPLGYSKNEDGEPVVTSIYLKLYNALHKKDNVPDAEGPNIGVQVISKLFDGMLLPIKIGAKVISWIISFIKKCIKYMAEYGPLSFVQIGTIIYMIYTITFLILRPIKWKLDFHLIVSFIIAISFAVMQFVLFLMKLFNLYILPGLPYPEIMSCALIVAFIFMYATCVVYKTYNDPPDKDMVNMFKGQYYPIFIVCVLIAFMLKDDLPSDTRIAMMICVLVPFVVWVIKKFKELITSNSKKYSDSSKKFKQSAASRSKALDLYSVTTEEYGDKTSSE